eukprot:1160786-Pelagomonas_calceolata.AAC.14
MQHEYLKNRPRMCLLSLRLRRWKCHASAYCSLTFTLSANTLSRSKGALSLLCPLLQLKRQLLLDFHTFGRARSAEQACFSFAMSLAAAEARGVLRRGAGWPVQAHSLGKQVCWTLWDGKDTGRSRQCAQHKISEPDKLACASAPT